MATYEAWYGTDAVAYAVNRTKIVNAPGAYKHIRVTSWFAHGNEVANMNPYVLANTSWTFYFGSDSSTNLWSKTYNNSTNSEAKKLSSFNSSATSLTLNLPQNEALWIQATSGCKNKWLLTVVYSIIDDNTAPAAPTILWPAAASKTTYNSKPYFKMKTTDPQGQSMTYQYKIDSGSWTNAATSVSSGTEKSWRASSAVSAGSHTLHVRAYDGALYSSESSRSFTYAAPTSLSNNPLIQASHMSTLKTYIDNLSAYYGTGSSTTITAPSANTNTIANSDWTNYVTKINATPNISGLAKPGQYEIATQSYYNSFITKLQSG